MPIAKCHSICLLPVLTCHLSPASRSGKSEKPLNVDPPAWCVGSTGVEPRTKNSSQSRHQEVTDQGNLEGHRYSSCYQR